MAENLYVRVAGDMFEWLLMDEGSRVVRVRGEGDFATFTDLIHELGWAGRTRVLLASESVLLTHAAVPSRQARQVLQAVPYMVEESLATDVDRCHFAVGPRDETGQVSVAVVDKARMESLVSLLSDIGLHISSVTPDVLHVPWNGGASVLVGPGRVCVRTGKFRGFATEIDLLPTVVSLLDEPARDSLHIRVHPAQKESFGLYLSQIEAEYQGDIQLEELDCSPFEFLCRSWDATALNLLQGEFKVEDEHTNSYRGWRVAGILAASAFALQVMLLVGRGIYLDVMASQYDHEAHDLYAQVFPQDHNVSGDLMRRWQSHLAAGSGQPTGVFFDLFSKAAGHLPGTNLTLENVNYSESRGDLILQLSAPRYDAFDGFAQTLRKNGLDVEIGTISQDADAVKGSIKVRSGSS